MLITAVCTLLALSGYTQTPKDTSVSPDPDSSLIDTPAVKTDTLSGFDLDAPVIYNSRDSTASSPSKKLIYLYGNASVTYENQVLTAHYIEINMEKNEVLARGKTDSTGKVIEKVNFKDGENELEASEVRYNLKSKKGMVKEVLTTEGEGYIHMEKAKKQPDNEVHLRNGKYTTCDLENPHYHFRLSKAIVIPDDKIVTGPMYMVVWKIPTPLALPFGYFPNKKGKVKGLIIPQFGSSPTYGYYLLNGGYYIPWGQKMDFQFLGDIFSRGSFGLKNITRYKVRYRYNGNVNLSYNQYRNGDPDFPNFTKNNNYFFRWTHNQDPKARPGSRLTADVNIGTLDNFQNSFTTYTNDYIATSFQSNVSYTKTWLGTPFSLATSLRHNQNRVQRTLNLTVPELTFNVTRFFPFKKQTPSIRRSRFKEVYENIGVSVVSNLRNDIATYDSLFAVSNLDRLLNRQSRNGVRHSASIGTTWKLPGDKFTFNPSVNMVERWYLQTLNKTYVGGETMVAQDTVNGFARNFEYSLVGSLTTRIIGMYSSRNPNGPKLRHILTPTLSLNYRPDFDVQKTVQSDTLGTQTYYSPYALGVFGAPSPYKSGSIGLTLNNSLELKKRSTKDTITGFVKIPIIENFQASGFYDLAKDTNQLSNLSFTARNTFFKVLNVNYSSVLDPYYYENGMRTRYYFWKRGQGLGRITSNNLAVNYTFKAPARKKKTPPKKLSNEEQEEVDALRRNSGSYVDFDVPLTLTAGYNLNFTRTFLPRVANGELLQVDTVLIKHTINVKGDVNITKKLKIGTDLYYDFIANKVNYVTFDLYYDLHCWEFSANVIPFGQRKSYTVTLNVKASILQDLRLQRRRSWVDQ